MNGLSVWGHVLLAALALGVLGRAAAHAARVRRRGPGEGVARARHRAWARAALAAVVLTWGSGLASVWVGGQQPAMRTAHFRVGTAVLLLLAGNAWLGRRLPDDRRARTVHPWVGAAALLAAGLQVFLGLELLRR